VKPSTKSATNRQTGKGGAPWVEVATAATPMAAPATGLPPPQERGT